MPPAPIMKFLACVMVLLLAGCATPAATYVQADRAMFRALAPEYLAYVLADPELELLDRQAAAALIIVWDEMIRAEEQRQELGSPAPYPDEQLIKELSSAGIKRLAGSQEP